MRWENSPVVAAIAIMLVVGALFAGNIVITRSVAVADAERITASFARLLAEHAARTLDIVDKSLETADEIHHDFRHGAIDATEAYRRLKALQGTSPMLRNLAWSTADGLAEVASTAPVLRGVSIADREYFIHHLNVSSRNTYIGKPVRARGGAEEWVIPVSRRLETADGRFDGIVAGVVTPTYFAGFYRSLDLGPSRTVEMRRGDGTVMTREPDGERHIGTDGARSADAGIDRILGRAKVPGHDLEVTVAMARGAVLDGWRTDVWSKLVLLAILFAALVWGTLVIRRRTLAELRHIYEIEAARSAAEQASQAKSTFLSTMSHELRTPLNAILGFADLMLHNIYGQMNTKQREGLADIAEAGRHLLQLINSLLDISKIEAGRMQLRLERLDPSEAVDDAIRMVRPLAAESGVVVEADMQVTPLLLADRQALHQILVNLLSNAIKFTPRGGRVTARLARTARGLQLSVADTGIGIPAADLQRVLEPYVQSDQQAIYQRGPRGKGTGLGLPLAKQLAELHGAEFTLASVEGEGTTVTLLFPSHRLIEPDMPLAQAG